MLKEELSAADLIDRSRYPIDALPSPAGRELVAVLAFHGKPGVTNSDEVRQLFWGWTS